MLGVVVVMVFVCFPLFFGYLNKEAWKKNGLAPKEQEKGIRTPLPSPPVAFSGNLTYSRPHLELEICTSHWLQPTFHTHNICKTVILRCMCWVKLRIYTPSVYMHYQHSRCFILTCAVFSSVWISSIILEWYRTWPCTYTLSCQTRKMMLTSTVDKILNILEEWDTGNLLRFLLGGSIADEAFLWRECYSSLNSQG